MLTVPDQGLGYQERGFFDDVQCFDGGASQHGRQRGRKTIPATIMTATLEKTLHIVFCVPDHGITLTPYAILPFISYYPKPESR